MLYLISLIVLIPLYIIGIFFIDKLKKTKIVNTIFILLIYSLYLFVVIRMLINVGVKDWNFQNTLPTANVSPFMFNLVFISLFLPKKVKKVIYTLVCLLSLGMVIAGSFSFIGNYLRNYKFHLTIFFDTLAHFLLSLFGIYLIKTKQIELTKKMVTISSLFIVFVAIIMLILNLIFKTSFFGLNLYGNHNIYNMVLVKNKYLSTLIYFVGLNLVLIIGYFYQKIFFVQKRS